jgi:hypothetical protein
MHPNDPLDPLLRQWKVPAPQPGAIRQEMWRRIARDERTDRINRTSWNWVHWFSQPAFAAAFVACCVLVGLFVAELRVSHERHLRQVALARHYVAVIDPLAVATGPDHGGVR